MIRNAYAKYGITTFYKNEGHKYRNPHEANVSEAISLAILRWKLDLLRVIDLACGSGEATLALLANGATIVDGVDPYTGAAYFKRVGKPTTPFSFEQIAAGALSKTSYNLIVCSYALHLLEVSRLPLLYYRLAEISKSLLILSPHKRPAIGYGWTLQDEFVYNRVRVRLAFS